MYEKGKYRVKVLNQGFASAKTGTDFFFLEVEPVGIYQDGNVYQCEDHYPRTIRLYITDKTVSIVADKLRDAGWPGGTFKTLDPDKPGSFSFVGMEIDAVCAHEPAVDGSGKMYDKFDLPFGGEFEPTVSDAAVSSKLDALYGKQLQGQKPAPPRQPHQKSSNSLNEALAEAAASNDEGSPF